MITEQDFLDAEEHYLNLADEELERFVKKASEEQPAIVVFVAAYYDSLNEEESKDFFIRLVYSIWIAYNNKYKMKRKVSIEEIEKMDEADEKLMNELNDNQDAIINEAIKRMTEHPQAALLGYLYMRIGDFFDFDEAGDDVIENSLYHDSGIISGAINSLINLFEKSRQFLYST